MSPLERNLVVHDLLLHSWRPFMWIVLITFLVYSHILAFSEYSYHDDSFLIIDSYSSIQNLSKIGHAFLEDVSHQGQGGNLYRPLLTISLILSAQISGMMPFGYHLTDIILHCACCSLLFITLQMLGFKRSISFVGTLLFCLHPVVTQAIAWIPGRNDSLLAVFILSCFISFIKFLSTSRMKWYFFHLLCFAAAMFSKETSIMFPVVALMYFHALEGKKVFSFTTLLFIFGWGIILINWHILRTAAAIVPIRNLAQAMMTVLSNFWIAIYYLGKIFWPFNLAFAPISMDIHIITGIIVVTLFSLAMFFSERKNWRLILFGIMWFFAFLVPTFYYDLNTHTLPKFYEHRIYLPSMGIVFILLSLSFTNKIRKLNKVLPPVVCLILISLGWLSYTHTFNFKNSLSLSEYDVISSPNEPRRYSDITRMTIPEKLDQEIKRVQGKSQLQESNHALISKEELNRIIDDLRNEQKLNPTTPDLHHALAVACFSRGLFLSSEVNFLAAIRDNPRDATIPYNLGILYYSAQPKMKAEHAWQEALRINPAMGITHLNLSFLYYESGQYYSAWNHCQRAVKLGIAVPSNLVDEIRKNL